MIWLYVMWRVRRVYKRTIFSTRHRFLNELRPRLSTGDRMLYPEAMMHVKLEDLRRAEKAISK